MNRSLTLVRNNGRRQVALRQEQATRLKIAGAKFAAVVRQLGCSKQQAWRDIQSALAETLKLRNDNADELRAMELEKLDRTRRHQNRQRDGGRVQRGQQ